MVLQQTGGISFSKIQTEFGGVNPVLMSEYYQNAITGHTSGISGIPNTGSSIKISQFRGKSKTGETFAIYFNNATIPSTDLYGTALSSGGSPVMVNTERGYVLYVTSGNYLYTTNNISINSSYTKSCWIYKTGNSVGNLMSSHLGNSPIHYFWFSNGQNLSAGHSAASTINTYVTDPTITPTNTWVHYALTYDNNTQTMTLYKNGVSVSSSTSAALAWSGSTSQMSIGAYGGGNFFNGYIDDTRLYNRALTSQEVMTLYQS